MSGQLDLRAYVEPAAGGWKRFSCRSQHGETVWHKTRAGAEADAKRRVGPAFKVEKRRGGVTVFVRASEGWGDVAKILGGAS